MCHTFRIVEKRTSWEKWPRNVLSFYSQDPQSSNCSVVPHLFELSNERLIELASEIGAGWSGNEG